MKKIPIIMDCDPGHDDAIALVLAFASEKLDVKAVTVTGGNQTLAKTLNNAKKVLSYIGKRPPLAAGADKPMFRELEVAEAVHGESGLDGPILPETDYKEERTFPGGERLPAVDLMRRIILDSPEPITLVPTGPLTNLGILFTAYPEVKKNIARISLMGGGIESGNWSAAAEFNIFVDPEAAEIVFTSGLPIIMSPLDVSHKALMMPGDLDALRKQGGRVSVMVAELVEFFYQYHIAQGFAGAPLHDPCAVAALIAPELFKTAEYHISIETKGKYTTGMTFADRRFWTNAKPNATVCLDIDRPGFIRLIAEACKTYD
ncbi:MAG: nucleoside hydrolase [Spirochaetaceae bacterium]|jgi:pyrimidine-specific ribonucleoside hydrolase|nr:nucleoside hydrolase [Spirochaetaceae bacterium]